MVWIWVEHEAYLGDNLGMAQSGVGCLGATYVSGDLGALVVKMLAKVPFAANSRFHLRYKPLGVWGCPLVPTFLLSRV